MTSEGQSLRGCMINASAHERKDVWAEGEQHKQWVSERWFASVQRKCSWLTVTRHSKNI
jgi:hypothetical protein